MNRDVPEELDWVRERAACIPYAIFETLRNQIEGDMHARNALTAESGFIKRNFTFQDEGNWFAVILQRSIGEPKGVSFHLTSIGLKVRDVESRRVLFEASLTLSDDGKCRLKADNTEYNLWQFRKLALHDLFFVDQEIVV